VKVISKNKGSQRHALLWKYSNRAITLASFWILVMGSVKLPFLTHPGGPGWVKLGRRENCHNFRICQVNALEDKRFYDIKIQILASLAQLQIFFNQNLILLF
jgi:hypothetical protein